MMTAKAAHRKDLSGKTAAMTHQHFRQIAAILRTMDWELVLADAGRLAPELAPPND